MTDAQQVNEDLQAATAETGNKAGKYLTFRLAAEEYGLEILKVREIIGLMDITQVPRTPHYIRGVINLRGIVIPVLDLRSKFSMENHEDTEESCIIVVEIASQTGSVQMGILVDAVSEVLDIEEENIQDAPSFGGDVNTDFILGMGKVKDEVKILLDIDKVLTAGDISMAENAAQGKSEQPSEAMAEAETTAAV